MPPDPAPEPRVLTRSDRAFLAAMDIGSALTAIDLERWAPGAFTAGIEAGLLIAVRHPDFADDFREYLEQIGSLHVGSHEQREELISRVVNA